MRLPLLVLLSALAVAVASCRDRSTERCRALLKQNQYTDALAVCEAAWKARRDAIAGGGVTTAQFRLKQYEAVGGMAAQLAGTAGESEAQLNVGRVHVQHRRSQQARASFEQAIRLAPATGDHKSATVAAYELFQMALAQSRYGEALAAISRAEEQRKRAGLEDLRRPILTGLFDVLYEVGDIGAARSVLARAAALARPGDADKMRYIRSKQALVHAADGSWALERQALQETLALNQRAVPPRPGLTWSTLVNLLELAIERQDVAEAETYLAQATAFHRKHHKPGGTAALVLLHRRARLHRLKGELDQARRLIGEARALRPSDEVAWGILTDEGEISEALGDPQAAIQAYQAAIGVLDGVHDAMGTSELQLWSLAKKRRPFARLFALYARRGDAAKAFRVWNRYQRRAATERLLTSSVPPGESVAEVSQAARDRLELVSRAAKPLRAAHALPEGDATPDRRLQGLDGLFYFEAVDDVYVITVRRGALAVRALGRRPDELAAQAAAFVARPEDAQLASQLGALLFPAGSLPPRDGLVYLSPSPGLAEVPFGALRVGGKAVVERVALALIPGLAAFERPLRRPGGPALIVADPLGDLPAARAEAIDLAGRIGAPATPFLGSMASKDLLRAGASPLIHLATHSGLGPTGPWLQFHDGRLQTGDILNGSFRPHTVVLPTCASAVGRGPGITPSLGAAFLAAGAESVVGSLRSLDDQVSRRFMRAFYEQGGAEDPARAVAQVQRRWLRDRPVGEWAPFVVLGRSAVTNPGGGRPMASRSPLAGEHR